LFQLMLLPGGKDRKKKSNDPKVVQVGKGGGACCLPTDYATVGGIPSPEKGEPRKRGEERGRENALVWLGNLHTLQCREGA